MAIVAGVAAAACSDASDVVLENRCPVAVWVRVSQWAEASVDRLAEEEPLSVAAGATVRLPGYLVTPPKLPAEPSTMAVSGTADAIGPAWPLPYVEADDVYVGVVEGLRCPAPDQR